MKFSKDKKDKQDKFYTFAAKIPAMKHDE